MKILGNSPSWEIHGQFDATGRGNRGQNRDQRESTKGPRRAPLKGVYRIGRDELVSAHLQTLARPDPAREFPVPPRSTAHEYPSMTIRLNHTAAILVKTIDFAK